MSQTDPDFSTQKIQPKNSNGQQKTLNFLAIIQLLFGLILILAGASLLVANALHKVNLSAKPTNQTAISPQEIATKPAKIYIPKLERVLYVSDGYLDNNRWTVSETGVSYYSNSARPGEIGNSVIYGHNRRDILGGLWRVQDGDTIYVIMDSGDFVKYQVFEKKEIQPTQVEILNQTADSRLTVYTCSGFLDQTRFVVVAKQLIV